MKKLRLSITCPDCHQSFYFVKKEKQISFCPHCGVSLYFKNSKDSKHSKHPKSVTADSKSNSEATNIDSKKLEAKKRFMPKWLALIIALFVGGFLYVITLYRESIKADPALQSLIDALVIGMLIILIALFMVSIIKYFINREMQAGVDTLTKIRDDSCDYQPSQTTPYQCEVCHSFRLVDRYWYKRILAKNNEEIPKIADKTDTARFVGCLHCKTQYQLEANVWDKQTQNLFMGIIILFAVIFIFNSIIQQSVVWVMTLFEFIPEKYGLFWSLMTAFYVYNSLTFQPESAKPLYPLKKIS